MSKQAKGKSEAEHKKDDEKWKVVSEKEQEITIRKIHEFDELQKKARHLKWDMAEHIMVIHDFERALKKPAYRAKLLRKQPYLQKVMKDDKTLQKTIKDGWHRFREMGKDLAKIEKRIKKTGISEVSKEESQKLMKEAQKV